MQCSRIAKSRNNTEENSSPFAGRNHWHRVKQKINSINLFERNVLTAFVVDGGSFHPVSAKSKCDRSRREIHKFLEKKEEKKNSVCVCICVCGKGRNEAPANIDLFSIINFFVVFKWWFAWSEITVIAFEPAHANATRRRREKKKKKLTNNRKAIGSLTDNQLTKIGEIQYELRLWTRNDDDNQTTRMFPVNQPNY